ncbi:MAG: DUF6635 family protein [Gammaproteobacteria bacterium]
MNVQPVPPSPQTRRAIIENAFSNAVDRYIVGCESRVDWFVKRHYSFRGALRIHSYAVGLDLLRVPVNIVWSILNVLLAVLALLAKAAGFEPLYDRIKRIPPGLLTDMDRQISWLVMTELLALPCAQKGRESSRDALMEAIMADPALKTLIDHELRTLTGQENDPSFRRELDRKLAEYGASRTGTAELASNIMTLVTSKIALGHASSGALSAGSAVSASVAHAIAVSDFWLGPVAGSLFYAVVPVTVSMRLLIAITALFSIVLGLATTFFGILTDPIQAKLGWHQKRLRKLVSSIEKDLKSQAGGEFQLKEKYLGRVFDVVDFLAVFGRSL